ncbi:MAG: XisI protein [Pseudanabaena sp. CRU_2_10]|nr:XisI protein [Pseudanabaena sp. CRU_2_10]
MEKLAEYRQKVRSLLREIAEYGSSDRDVESQLIFDVERDRYQLVHVGWRNKRRIYGCVIHIDIKDGKVWIQHNGTEFDIAVQLVKLGIQNQDVVIGFHSPFMRKFTEYAIG